MTAASVSRDRHGFNHENAARENPGGNSLLLHDIRGLRSLRPLGHVEGDALIFLEGPESAILDGGVMDEEIGSTLIRGDEAVTLFGVEPLDGALSHGTT